MNRPTRFVIILTMAVSILVGAGVMLLVYLLRHSPRYQLPPTATSIYERRVDFGNDGIYFLKATLTPGDAKVFISKFHFDLHTSARVYSDDKMWLSWQAEVGDIPWWDPSGDLSSTYVEQEKHSWVFMKYERGHLYYKSITH